VTICQLLFDKKTKSDLRVNAVDCIRSIQNHIITEKVWLWSHESSQQEELKRITAQCHYS